MAFHEQDATVGSLEVSGSGAGDNNFTLSDSTFTVKDSMNVAGNATLTGSSLNVEAGGMIVGGALGLEDSHLTVVGNASVVGDASLSNSALTVTEDSVMGGNLSLDNSQLELEGDLNTLAGDLTLDKGSRLESSIISMAGGDADILAGSLLDADLSGVNNLDVDNSRITGDVSLAGALTLDASTIDGDVIGATSTSIENVVAINSLQTAALSLAEGSTLTVDTGASAAGDLSILGSISSLAGDISLTGDADSVIDANITALAGNIALAGDITITNSLDNDSQRLLSATDGITIAKDATITASDVKLSTAGTIALDGTLNAGEGVSLASSVIGAGTLNKSGGDTLTLQAGSDLSAGQVNVTGQSTLDATAGVQLGDLHVSSDSTLIVANTGLASMGTVSAEDVIFDAPGAASSSALVLDVDLATQKSDLLSAKSIDFNGAKVAINGHNLLSESSIADQTYITIATGEIAAGDEASMYVDHNLVSLNAHTYTVTDATTGTESVQIKLSKNYIGAAKTENQSAVATAPQSLNLNEVEGSELGAVLAALGQTQSEADALIALDSLNGYELANMNRFVVDAASHHLLTLRNTTLVMSESLGMEEGKRSAASLIITGGGSDLNSDGNGSDYSSSSIGFMLVGARKVTDRWTAGYSFAYSSDSADAGSASMDSNTFYLDASMVYHGKRNTQVFTLGAGFYDLSTSRNVHINAPGYSINGQAEGSTNAALINLGYEMDYSFMNRDAAHLVSAVAQLDATFGTIEGFSEKGMGNAGLYVDPDAIVSVTAAAGARYRHNYQMNGQSGFFSAEMLLTANTGNNEASISNRFIGGGPSFTQHASDSSNIGLRLNINGLVPIDEDWSAFGSVNAEFRTDQNSVNAAAGVKYSF